MDLRQGNVNIVEYVAKFMEFARFSPDLITHDNTCKEWFENKPEPNLHKQLVASTAYSYRSLHDEATHIEGINRGGWTTKLQHKNGL